ncbi:TrbI/VirB10 family protein [Cysteiniphilum sp. 6C5]|uniref:TrbI/VirB10 family protein n=1 Tax=unclassified Cysteiniphilum TaxID=2610889 RepID=UPI003F87901B
MFKFLKVLTLKQFKRMCNAFKVKLNSKGSKGSKGTQKNAMHEAGRPYVTGQMHDINDSDQNKENKENKEDQKNDKNESVSTDHHQTMIDATVFEKNKDTKKRLLTLMIFVAVAGGFIWLLTIFMSSKAKVKPNVVIEGDDKVLAAGEFVKIKGATFTADDNKSALTHQQRQIDDVVSQLDKLTKENHSLNDSLDRQRQHFEQENSYLKKQLSTQQQETQRLIDEANKTEKTNKAEKANALTSMVTNSNQSSHGKPIMPQGESVSQWDNQGNQNNQNNQGVFGQGYYAHTEPVHVVRLPVSFTTTVVEKDDEGSQYIRNYTNYVPTGTFCEAKLLGAAEAQAGVDAQGDASPILFEVKNHCILPNGKQSKLKGAFITASVYGRISSSRGMVRLEHLSLVRKDGSILDIGVEGTAFDLSGKNGIRGEFKLRNDKVIMNAGIAGLLSGLGESASQYSQTQSVSPLGATTTIDASKILPNALGKGASQSFGEISKYYIEFAKQFQPTIDLRAGAKVNIVFLKGFPIVDEARIGAYEQKVEAAREERIKKANMQPLNVPASAISPTSSMRMPAYNMPPNDQTANHYDASSVNPFGGDERDTRTQEQHALSAPLPDGLPRSR